MIANATTSTAMMATDVASTSFSAPVAADETQAAIQKYGLFVEEVLRPQLQDSLSQRDVISSELREYEELLAFITDQQQTQHLQVDSADEESKHDTPGSADAVSGPPAKALHLLMDVGERFQVRAKVPDPTRITVDIGLQFHVEMTLPEAHRFVTRHLQHLSEKQRQWQEKARQISDHVNLVLEAIQRLAMLQ